MPRYDAYCRLLALPDDTPDLRRRGYRVTAPAIRTAGRQSAQIQALRQAWLTHRLSDWAGEGAGNEPVLVGAQTRPRLVRRLG